MKKSKSPKVQAFQGPGGPKVPKTQGPRYLKLTFKYELDSKEGPSCLLFNDCVNYGITTNVSGNPKKF